MAGFFVILAIFMPFTFFEECKKKDSVENKGGFTLIELMIVIAIIGILAAIAIPQFLAYRTRSYNISAKSDLKNLCIAQEAYFVDFTTYADAAADITGITYGAFISDGVTVTVNTGNTTLYNMSAVHRSGDITYTVSGPGGNINP